MEDIEELPLGMRLHRAEEAIHQGRLAVSSILSVEPVDLEALEAAKLQVVGARALRREIIRERRIANTNQSVFIGRTGWYFS